MADVGDSPGVSRHEENQNEPKVASSTRFGRAGANGRGHTRQRRDNAGPSFSDVVYNVAGFKPKPRPTTTTSTTTTATTTSTTTSSTTTPTPKHGVVTNHPNNNNHGGQTNEPDGNAGGRGNDGTDAGTGDQKEGESQGQGTDDDHNHDKDRTNFSCKPMTGQHSGYIEKNLEILQRKCREFQACTDELYSAENFHRVLAGQDFQLKNICGLLYKNGTAASYGSLGEKCSETEREAIRQDIEDSLTRTLADRPRDQTNATWTSLKRCLNRRPGDTETYVNKVCRKKAQSRNTTKEGFLCLNHEVDTTIEQFFNHELEHLHCSCAALTASKAEESVSLKGKIGMGVGLGLIGLLFIIIIVLCRRHHKLKRRLTKERLRYLPSPFAMDEASAVYQEIGDMNPNAMRRDGCAVGNPGYPLTNRPPTLPVRYVKNSDMTRSQNNLTGIGDNEYLEPLADLPDIRHLKPGEIQQPLSNITYDLAKHPDAVPDPPRQSGPYEKVDFSSIRRDSGEEDGGYSTLGRRTSGKKASAGEASKDSEETVPLNSTPPAEADAKAAEEKEPKYFILEPEKECETQSLVVTQL